MRPEWVRLGVFLAIVALCTVPANAISLITNGTFDAPGTSAGGFSTTCTSPAPTCAALPGWTINYLANNGQIDCIVPGNAVGGSTPTHICTPGDPPSTRIFNGSYLFTLYQTPGFSPDGGNYFLADGGTPFSASIQQTITGLTVGQVYKLSFWQAAGMENCVFDDGPARLRSARRSEFDPGLAGDLRLHGTDVYGDVHPDPHLICLE
jgi:hypothetical protein